MSAHTPGSWVVPPDSDGFSIETVDGKIIAQAMQVSPPTNPFRHQERRANARLIAAAPDLLAALVAMNTLAKGPSAGVTQAQKREVIAAADAAIAKVTGVV